MLLHHYRFHPDPTLFDATAFREALARDRQPIPLFKQALRTIRERLDEIEEVRIEAAVVLSMR